jgi:hypothetical protein
MAKINNDEFVMRLEKFMEENGIREIVLAAHFKNDLMHVLQAASDGSLTPVLNDATIVINNMLNAAQKQYRYTMN